MTTMAIDTIHIYRDGTTWCYAAWAGGEHDHNDTTDAASEAEVRAELAGRWPDATITRVQDVDPVRTAAATLGRRGGARATEAQKAAARANGRKGGRPRGTYIYCVTDGTRKTPRGHVGYADTRAEALALRAEKCHMGGYITRERVAATK